MIKRLRDILDDIYNVSDMVLIDEYEFWKFNGQQKYFVERLKKEIERRKKDNSILDTPVSNRLVYVVKCNEFYKIGLTDEVTSRINSLQIGNPYKLTLFLCSYFDNAEQTEKDLHERFKDRRVLGEWFKLTTEDLVYLKELYGNKTN